MVLDAVFPAAHLHPLLVAALTGQPVRRGVGEYATTMAAVALVRSVPPRVRRPLGAVLAALAMTTARRRLALHGPWWVTAAYWVKLVAGHATA